MIVCMIYIILCISILIHLYCSRPEEANVDSIWFHCIHQNPYDYSTCNLNDSPDHLFKNIKEHADNHVMIHGRSRLHFVTSATSNILSYAAFAIAINYYYILQHGYTFSIILEDRNNYNITKLDKDARWNKVKYLYDIINEELTTSAYDPTNPSPNYLIWLDADVIITNASYSQTLLSLIEKDKEVNLFLSRDKQDTSFLANSGCMLMKVHPWTLYFLHLWWSTYDRNRCCDQNAFTWLVDRHIAGEEDTPRYLKILDAHILNTDFPAFYSSGRYGNFLHLAGLNTLYRLEIFHYVYCQLGIGERLLLLMNGSSASTSLAMGNVQTTLSSASSLLVDYHFLQEKILSLDERRLCALRQLLSTTLLSNNKSNSNKEGSNDKDSSNSTTTFSSSSIRERLADLDTIHHLLLDIMKEEDDERTVVQQLVEQHQQQQQQQQQQLQQLHHHRQEQREMIQEQESQITLWLTQSYTQLAQEMLTTMTMTISSIKHHHHVAAASDDGHREGDDAEGWLLLFIQVTQGAITMTVEYSLPRLDQQQQQQQQHQQQKKSTGEEGEMIYQLLISAERLLTEIIFTLFPLSASATTSLTVSSPSSSDNQSQYTISRTAATTTATATAVTIQATFLYYHFKIHQLLADYYHSISPSSAASSFSSQHQQYLHHLQHARVLWLQLTSQYHYYGTHYVLADPHKEYIDLLIRLGVIYCTNTTASSSLEQGLAYFQEALALQRETVAGHETAILKIASPGIIQEGYRLLEEIQWNEQVCQSELHEMRKRNEMRQQGEKEADETIGGQSSSENTSAKRFRKRKKTSKNG